MRILIAAPPKAGNMWLKCILSSIYDLELLKNTEVPPRADPTSFEEWAGQGRFRDGTIFHQHYDYSDEFCRAVEAVPAHLVSIIRDPYDAFVSHYFSVQQRAAGGVLRKGRTSGIMANKPLHHPDILAYLESARYQGTMVKANEWLHSGRSVVLRYEDLYRAPMEALTGATDQIGPVASERIARAVEACSAERMRQQGTNKAKHVRTATIGDSKNHLGEEHFRIFRKRYADLIRELGYEVV